MCCTRAYSLSLSLSLSLSQIHTHTHTHSLTHNDQTVSFGIKLQVINSKTENTPHHLYLNALEPYEVRRLLGGAIPAGAKVSMSFDFLPGKANFAGHSTPGAFGEPAYYAVIERGINMTMREFAPTMINFDHDEIRGMARDSRSLRTGLTNAQLLGREIIRTQAAVESWNPEATALFWDDMLNPYHNGSEQSLDACFALQLKDHIIYVCSTCVMLIVSL